MIKLKFKFSEIMYFTFEKLIMKMIVTSGSQEKGGN